MKASELRIGNLINYEDLICKVIALADNDIVTNKHSGMPIYFKGISITDEWLSKTILDKKAYGFYTEGNNFSIKLINGKVVIQTRKDTIPTNIQYVHQIQNLYFDLTGEEVI